jgi:flagellar hook-associated protein 2
MASDPGPATRLFTGDASLAKGLGDTLDRLLDTGGQFEGRSDSLGRMTKALAKDRSALDRRMDQVQARYRAQFVALDGLVSKLQSTGSFLIQQLGFPDNPPCTAPTTPNITDRPAWTAPCSMPVRIG